MENGLWESAIIVYVAHLEIYIVASSYPPLKINLVEW